MPGMKKFAVFSALVLMIAAGVRLSAQGPVVKGVLLTDASPDESGLWVDVTVPVAVDAPLIVESRDGSYRGVYRVRHVFDSHVLLESRLLEPYVAGSRILQ